MNKQQLKQTIDASDKQSIIEADINLYQSDIKQQAAGFLNKVAAESKRLKRPKVTLIAILQQ